MAIKLYDGNTWQTQKSLKLYDGTAWATAKQAWVYTGTQWTIMYPEYPLNQSAPTISATTGTAGRIGCIYTVNVGSWNANDAYAPTSYSYQWTRSGVDIFGATSSTYTTVADDAEKTIGCRVTATNLRGSTPYTVSTGVMMLPEITVVNSYDYTLTPTAPGAVTLSPSGLSYTGSWTAGSNATGYDGYGGGTAGTPSFNYGARTFSGTGTAGNAVVLVRSVNTDKKIFVSWNAAAGATSYDVYINGSSFVNVSPGTNNYQIFTVLDTAGRTFAVYPKTANYQGYGKEGSVTSAADKYSGYTQSNVETLSNPIPVNTSAPTLSPTGGYTAGQTLTYGVGSWSNSPTSYDLRLYRGTPGVVTSETLVAAPGNVTSATYTIPASDYDGTNRYYYRAFATATNSGGTSNGGTFTPGTEGGPLAQPVVIPSGGTTTLSGNVSTGSLLSASTSGWANSPTSYYIKITRGTQNVASYETTVASSFSSSTSYTVAASDEGYYFKAFATASNSAGTSSEVASGEKGPATNPVTAPGVPSASNNYDGKIGAYWTWTLTIGQGSGGTPTGYDWEVQFGSNGSTSSASSSGSVSGSGTKTVTRNSSTYSYARWRARSTNSAGTSNWSSWTAWL